MIITATNGSFYSQTTHGDRSSCRHCLRAVKCLLSPLVAISRKGVHGWLMTRRAERRVQDILHIFQRRSHGMLLSSRLSLVLYLLDPFLIFNGLMIKDFSVINNITCQMPVRGGMMSESMFWRFFFLWDSNYCLPDEMKLFFFPLHL